MKFRGKRYKIRYVKKIKGNADGECDAPHKQNKQIRINKRLTGQDKLSTLIHESLHACLWDIAEEAIHETADDIARFLIREGVSV